MFNNFGRPLPAVPFLFPQIHDQKPEPHAVKTVQAHADKTFSQGTVGTENQDHSNNAMHKLNPNRTAPNPGHPGVY